MTLKSHHLLTVLVVDDDPSVRAMLYRLFTREGYNVLEAADGVAALDVLAGPHRVDLLLTDVVMPRLGGCELVIAARRMMPDLPVIVISGVVNLFSAPFAQLKECFEVHEAIAKPFRRARSCRKCGRQSVIRPGCKSSGLPGPFPCPAPSAGLSV